MTLIEKILSGASEEEILKYVVDAPMLPKAQDCDPVLISRVPVPYGGTMVYSIVTRAEYEAWRKKVLETPLP